MAATYLLKKNADGKFVFTLNTHAGEVLLTSVDYAEKDSALRSISAARRLAHNARNYELLTAENGLLYFVVRNARKEVIVRSDMYPDSECLRNAMDRVKGTTRGARLEDLT
jgi:uncharacterized protein YegP (UPF0339 family)